MKTFKLWQFIERAGLNNSLFNAFTMPESEGSVGFVRRYFGGNFIAGWLERGHNYVAFCDDEHKPEGIPDAIVTDGYNHWIFIFAAE